MIYNAVKTEETAKQIINNHVVNNNLEGRFIKNETCRCECGDTKLVRWYSNDQEVLLSVAVCDMCGDDDAFIDEVLNVKQYEKNT